jgi:tetratricopeptide (TPR) repeat protein
MTTTVETLIKRNQWSKARKLIQEELVSTPTSHWLWMHLSLTYYEQKHYEKALQCSQRAVAYKPDCPLALWHYAGSLYMSGSEDAALAIWTLILNNDLEEVAYGECGEGMDWAMQLLNDVHYRIGKYYQHKGQNDLARISFEKYLHNRGHGVGSIYDRKAVKKYLAELAVERNGATSKLAPKRKAKP